MISSRGSGSGADVKKASSFVCCWRDKLQLRERADSLAGRPLRIVVCETVQEETA